MGLLSGTGQQAQFQADDMILIVHNALGAEAQRLGPQDLQLTTMDLTLAAAKLTVMGTGNLFVSGFVRTCCGSHLLLVREAVHAVLHIFCWSEKLGHLKIVPNC